MQLVKIKGNNNVVKDSQTGAILPATTADRDRYIQQKAMMNRTREVETELQDMKSQIAYLEKLILEKVNK